MNIIQASIYKIDQFQRRNHGLAFIYAVIKKYGDDEAGYQAALLTYYGFLSLFPLLLVLTTVVGVLASSHPHLQNTVINATTSYFPTIGSQLSAHVHGLHKTGLALLVGVLFTLYGARGVADAFRHGVNHIWRVPITDRDGFPKAQLKSITLVLVGGLGLILASISTTIAASVGHGADFRVLSLAVNLFVLFWLFAFLLNITLPNHLTLKNVRSGAATAAVGLMILQLLGRYLLARELKSLDALYSNFALALGLLFWIYLQAQVLYYAIEVTSVHTGAFWPRSLSGKDLTSADKRAYRGLATKEKAFDHEEVTAEFRG